MNTSSLIFGLAIGSLAGAVLGGVLSWLWSKSHTATLEAQLQIAQQNLQNSKVIQEENGRLKTQLAVQQKEREVDGEKLQWLQTAQTEIHDKFQSLASQVLQTNTEAFQKNAQGLFKAILSKMNSDWTTQKTEISGLVSPLEKNLQTLGNHVRELEQKREGAYKGLEEQIKQLGQNHLEIQKTTTDLTYALKSSATRGRWGEIQLKRIVEMSGMTNHIDFEEQITTNEGRPDMVIYLPNGGILPIDSKAPMSAYFDAVETSDSEIRTQKLTAHVQAMRGRVRELSNKKYWSQFDDKTPDFVVMFVPNEASLSAAFESDPNLLDETLNKRVLIASPVTLLALLKAVAHGWRQYHMAEKTQEIAREGKQLHERLAKFVDHLNNLGISLHRTVEHYNKSIGSFERRVMPTVRRFEDMDIIVEPSLPSPQTIEQTPKQLDLPDQFKQ